MSFSDRGANYFYAFFLLSLFLIAVFLIKYNFQYGVPDYNRVIGILLALTLATPFYYAKTKDLLVSQAALFVLAISTLCFFLYTAGGFQAPGIFWLSAVPMTGGMLLGRRGVVLGVLLFVIAVAVYAIAPHFTVTPNIIEKFGIYKSEKIFNFVTFSMYTFLTTAYFISNEASSRRRLNEQKQQVEMLLQVLMHDVASPLSVIQVHSSILHAQAGDERLQQSLERIRTSSTNLVKLLDGIRRLRAISDGKLDLKLEPVDLVSCVQSAIQSVSSRAEDKKIRIEVESAAPIRMLADPVIFSNVICANILVNAIKFSYPESRICVRAYLRENEVVLEFQDFGIGIPDAILKDLFMLGRKTRRKGTQSETGTGYGMFLMREFTHLLDGKAEVASSINEAPGRPRGTTVRLTFPRAKL